MKTVSRETAQKLKDVGFTNTEWWSEPRAFGTWSDPIRTKDPSPTWIPRPTADELREWLSIDDMDEYWEEFVNHTACPYKQHRWLYAITADPDKLAEVVVWKLNNRKENNDGRAKKSN